MNTDIIQIDDEDEAPVSFTKEALSAIKDAIFSEKIEDDQGLRIGIRGGGCAGYQYWMDFTAARPQDFVLNLDGIIVYIDPMSAMHLEGTTIDYQTTLMETGFKFINPNATKTCGCGTSFS